MPYWFVVLNVVWLWSYLLYNYLSKVVNLKCDILSLSVFIHQSEKDWSGKVLNALSCNLPLSFHCLPLKTNLSICDYDAFSKYFYLNGKHT